MAKRPSKPAAKREPVRTDKRLTEACALLRAGVPLRQAARALGIAKITLQKWLDEDDAAGRMLRQAQFEPGHKAVAVVIGRIEDGDFDAAKWFLERKWPEFRQLRAASDPVIDLIDELDEEQQAEVRRYILTNLPEKRKAEADSHIGPKRKQGGA